MNYIVVIILSILQGVTEFLPVSSSGHLAIARHLLDFDPDSFTFSVMALDIFLHFGSLIAIIYFFRDDIIKVKNDILKFKNEVIKHKGNIVKNIKLNSSDFSLNYLICICIGIFPAGLVGLFFKSNIESLFSDIKAVGIAYFISAVFLLSTLFIKRKDNDIDFFRAFMIGLFQILALGYGVSRSGITISTALLLGVSPIVAGKFSFIMVIPLIGGATLLELLKISISSSDIILLIIGVIVSTIVSYLSLKLLFIVLKNKRFGFFGIYCFLLAISILLFF